MIASVSHQAVLDQLGSIQVASVGRLDRCIHQPFQVTRSAVSTENALWLSPTFRPLSQPTTDLGLSLS